MCLHYALPCCWFIVRPVAGCVNVCYHVCTLPRRNRSHTRSPSRENNPCSTKIPDYIQAKNVHIYTRIKTLLRFTHTLSLAVHRLWWRTQPHVDRGPTGPRVSLRMQRTRNSYRLFRNTMLPRSGNAGRQGGNFSSFNRAGANSPEPIQDGIRLQLSKSIRSSGWRMAHVYQLEDLSQPKELSDQEVSLQARLEVQ
ncbi:hypothetical protein B0T19DRAFT_134797 [Cercophora scortea]|uniref:Uncharacterized protein n=1 Tax=Cercophora scortea TaxID=314031 RepID=A0AAE0MID6_9PEZI|nr:hypothetical protein B0T19DRAFT_134797 [Cercophora scortea]